MRSRRCFVKHSMRVRDLRERKNGSLENVKPSEFACKIALKGDLTGSQASENQKKATAHNRVGRILTCTKARGRSV